MRYSILPITFLALFSFASSTTAQTRASSSIHCQKAFATYGSGAGSDGFVASTEPGLNEIFLTGFSDWWFWQALTYDAGTGAYGQSYVSPISEEPIIQLTLGDVLANPGVEILVMLENGDLHIHEQSSKDLLQILSTGISGVTSFVSGDFDGDGTDEFAIANNSGVTLMAGNGSQISFFAGLTATAMVLGQMDMDPALELALNTGVVIDTVSFAQQCNWPNGFSNLLHVWDVDQDGMEELVYVTSLTAWSFDVDTCLPKWSFTLPNNGPVLVEDIDLDGTADLVLFTTFFDEIRCFDLGTFAQKWEITSPTRQTGAGLATDVDGDGTFEILWSGSRSFDGDRVYVLNHEDLTYAWISPEPDSQFTRTSFGDIDGDGVEEIVVGAYAFHDGRMVVIDPDTFIPRIVQSVAGGNDMDDLSLYDIDGDGDQEVIVANDTWLEVHDHIPGGTLNLIWDNSAVQDGSNFSTVRAIDLEGDGNIEIVAGTDSFLSTEIYVFDYNTGALNWISRPFGDASETITDIQFEDFDGDGVLEIIALLNKHSAFLFRADSTTFDTIDGTFVSMQLLPSGSSAPDTLYFGNKRGDFFRYEWDGTTFQKTLDLSLFDEDIDGFTLGTLPAGVALFGTEKQVHAISTTNGSSIWQSGNYGFGFGNSFLKLPNGGWVISGDNGIYSFSSN